LFKLETNKAFGRFSLGEHFDDGTDVVLIVMVKKAEFRYFFDFDEMIFGLFDAENILNCEGLQVRVFSEFFECLELCIAINFKHKLGVLLLE
jgi:hypothetical protein